MHVGTVALGREFLKPELAVERLEQVAQIPEEEEEGGYQHELVE